MPIRKITPSTSGYKSHAIDKYKLEATSIRPIQGPENSVVNQHSIIDNANKNGIKNRQAQIQSTLEKERKQAKRLLLSASRNLEKRIKDIILTYNQIMYLIVCAEEESETQIDQYIQHFFIVKRENLQDYGISIRQSIYLEYDTITLRNKVKYTSKREIKIQLFSEEGLFQRLFAVVDTVIEKLNNHIEAPKTVGNHFDSKA